MLSPFYRYTILLFLALGTIACHGQLGTFIQLEEINSTDLIKYYPGQSLNFTTQEYPNTWRKSKIVKIIPENQLIVLEEGYITPEEIHSIRRTNTGVLIFTHSLSKFAAAWFFYGAYASITDGDYKMSWGEAIIGAVAASIGWVVRKLFSKKRYVMDKLYKVRIMDIRYPAPKYETP